MLTSILILQVQFSIAVVIALLARQLMKKMPKKYSYLLWILVFIRLLCPVSIDSKIGVMPATSQLRSVVDTQYGNGEQKVSQQPVSVESNDGQNPNTMITKNSQSQEAISTSERIQIGLLVMWVIGTLCILIYNIIAIRRLHKVLQDTERMKDNILLSSRITTPFTLGLRKVRIYLPSCLEREEQRYIICHEQVHIRRKDYVVKNLAFLLVACYWFNPFVWIAFHFMEQDMEMSCDEEVIAKMGADIRRQYSQSLLDFATGYRNRAFTPLTFGEVGVKKRVRNVLSQKVAKRWRILLGCILIGVVALMIFTTQEIKKPSKDLVAGNNKSEEETGNESEQSAVKEEEIATFLNEWANAFCDRDVYFIEEHIADEALQSLEEEELFVREEDYSYFGWSSPWPMAPDGSYRIMEVSENDAVILYYAFTSDPHITIWCENIEFQEKEAGYEVISEKMKFMENISSEQEFYEAYAPGIPLTPMDYTSNGLGELLSQNALLSSSMMYPMLSEPGLAVRYLLNLTEDESQVTTEIVEEDGEMNVNIHFEEENTDIVVKMVQLDGEAGVWVPQSFQ